MNQKKVLLIFFENKLDKIPEFKTIKIITQSNEAKTITEKSLVDDGKIYKVSDLLVTDKDFKNYKEPSSKYKRRLVNIGTDS